AICSVSRLRIVSALSGSAQGTLLRGEGGAITERLQAEAAAGTTVEIRDLFFNTPARLKFLKSPQSELAAALRVAEHLALAHPSLHFRVTHNGRAVLSAPRAAALRDRVGALLGDGVARQMLELEPEGGGVGITGLISPPQLARGNRDGLVIIVNGRPVKDTLIQGTLLEAYRPLLARDQFPVAVLCLTVPAGEVDVNVHPSKAWVRFRQPRVIQEAVFRRIQARLRSQEVIGPPGALTQAPGVGTREAADRLTEAAPVSGQGLLFQESQEAYAPGRFGLVVGQLQETFVVSADDEEVFFIDQHVAHERVLFDRLKAERAAGAVSSQALLFPEPVELGPAGRAILAECLPALSDLGFSIEEFGRGAFLLRAVPSLLKGEEPRQLIEALLDELRPARPAAPPLVDRVLAFVACRAAVKAHQPLDAREMARLLRDLSATETPYFCPHGRPIVSRVSLKEIRRELRRTW
ncbi:MAG: hypothetical protein HY724_06650, partial [Candidatus Rokubacteria bacterium]|nr:hypothetical protein [Candidatus Rokubacteria bacterium]